MNPLSAYILTWNSEQYLPEILAAIDKVADEIVVLDSGSTDNTENIVKQYSKAKFEYRKFDNFKEQRNYAADLCSYENILFLDSDEIPNEMFIRSIDKIKESGFTADAYAVKREWLIMGKKVHSIYPIVSPDYPIRLINKKCVSFDSQSRMVHETPAGFKSCETIGGILLHKTFQTKEELFRKLEQYTDIAAKDLAKSGKKIGLKKEILNPIASFIKWYFLQKGYKDGWIGFVLGKYAYGYTKKKYQKARKARGMF